MAMCGGTSQRTKTDKAHGVHKSTETSRRLTNNSARRRRTSADSDGNCHSASNRDCAHSQGASTWECAHCAHQIVGRVHVLSNVVLLDERHEPLGDLLVAFDADVETSLAAVDGVIRHVLRHDVLVGLSGGRSG